MGATITEESNTSDVGKSDFAQMEVSSLIPFPAGRSLSAMKVTLSEPEREKARARDDRIKKEFFLESNRDVQVWEAERNGGSDFAVDVGREQCG